MEQETRAKKPLNISNGIIMDAVLPDNQVLFSGKVDNYNGDTLYLLSPTGASVPPISFGAEVKLRCKISDDRVDVYHGTILGSKSDLWKVGELCDWYGWNRRDFFRQPLAVEAKSLRQKRAHPEAARGVDVAVDCKLLDISGGGALLACSQAVYERGDQISVFDVQLLPDERPFSFMCEVKRVEKARFNHIFGCEFFGMDEREQECLVRTVFRLQLEARRKKARDE